MRSRRNAKPATRATRIEPGVERPEARNPRIAIQAIRKPTKWALEAARGVRRTPGVSFQPQDFDHPLRGFGVFPNPNPGFRFAPLPLRGISAPLHPGLYSGRPRSRA
jgi:hypothetical protein